jgi:hypothetical protein
VPCFSAVMRYPLCTQSSPITIIYHLGFTSSLPGFSIPLANDSESSPCLASGQSSFPKGCRVPTTSSPARSIIPPEPWSSVPLPRPSCAFASDPCNASIPALPATSGEHRVNPCAFCPNLCVSRFHRAGPLFPVIRHPQVCTYHSTSMLFFFSSCARFNSSSSIFSGELPGRSPRRQASLFHLFRYVSRGTRTPHYQQSAGSYSHPCG